MDGAPAFRWAEVGKTVALLRAIPNFRFAREWGTRLCGEAWELADLGRS